MKKERQPGFYWVKYASEWTIGFWNYYGTLDWDFFFVDSDVCTIYDKHLEEIIETPITPPNK